MNLNDLLSAEFSAHETVLRDTLDAVSEPFSQLAEQCQEAAATGNAILFFGNGGSAADAQHLATELTVRYRRDRPAIRAMALTTDSSALTAIGNDFGFDDLFSRQVEAMARPDDVVIGISTSGNSENIIRGLNAAQEMGAIAAGLSGNDGGRMAGLADPLVIVPSKDTARIQEMHILLGHILCGYMEDTRL